MNKLLTLNILILLLISCANKEKKGLVFYIEKQTSFLGLTHSDWTKNTWIRKPENLKTIHESFKKFGYEKLEKRIFKSDNEFLIHGIYIKRNFEIVMDSLQLAYNNPKAKSKYYSEFWNRRKAEKNDSIVYEIIREFNSIKGNLKQLTHENEFVNDTLVDLLKVEFDYSSLSSKDIETQFYILKNYGFHQSAYNLLYERPENFKVLLNRDKLKK